MSDQNKEAVSLSGSKDGRSVGSSFRNDDMSYFTNVSSRSVGTSIRNENDDTKRLSLFMKSIQKKTKPSSKKDFYQAIDHVSKGDYSAAIVCFKKYLEIIVNKYGEDCDKAIFVRESIGATAVKMGNWREAKHQYGIALKYLRQKVNDGHDDPKTTRYYYRILSRSSELYLEAKEYNIAIECLDDAIKLLNKEKGRYDEEVLMNVKRLFQVKEEKAKVTEKAITKILKYEDAVRVLSPYLKHDNNQELNLDYREYFEESYLRIGCIIGKLLTNMENYSAAIEALLEILLYFGEDKENDDTLFRPLDIKKKISFVLHNVGVLYEKLDNYDSAIAYFERSLKVKVEIFGNEDPKMAELYLNLGFLYHTYRNDNHKAICSFIKANEITDFCSASTKQNYLKYYSALNILVILLSKKDLESAERYLEKMIKLAKRFIGSESEGREGREEVAALLHQLGCIQLRTGKLDESLLSLEESLSIKKSVSSDDLISLALSYRQLGRVQTILKMYDRALKSYEQSLKAPDSIEKVFVFSELATIYTEKKDLPEAINCYIRALALVSPNNPIYGSILNNLGNLHMLNGSNTKGIKCYENALELYSDASQSDLNETRMKICYNAGIYFLKRKYFTKANDKFQEFLKTSEQVCNEPQTSCTFAFVLNGIGNILFMQQNFEEAIKMYQESLEIRKNYYQHDSHIIMGIFLNLGLCNLHLGHFDLGLHHFRNALLSLKNNDQDLNSVEPDVTLADSIEAATILSCIANAYARKKNFDSSMKFYIRSLQMKVNIFRNESTDEVLLTKHNIGLLLCQQQRYSEAKDIIQQIYEIKLDKNNPGIAKLLLDLSALHFHLKDFEKAKHFYLLGTKYIDSCKSPSNLALKPQVYWLQKKLNVPNFNRYQ